MDTEKNKLAEIRVRNEFFSEFEGLVTQKNMSIYICNIYIDQRRSKKNSHFAAKNYRVTCSHKK